MALRFTSPVPACWLAEARRAADRMPPERRQRRAQDEGARIDAANVDARAAGRLAVAAHGGHGAAPLGARQRIVHDQRQAHEEAEHPGHAPTLVEIVDDELEPDGDRGGACDQAAEGSRRRGSPRGDGAMVRCPATSMRMPGTGPGRGTPSPA